MQNVEMREKQLNIRLSEEEAERLDRVAAHYGLNAAGVIRMLLKREDDIVSDANKYIGERITKEVDRDARERARERKEPKRSKK